MKLSQWLNTELQKIKLKKVNFLLDVTDKQHKLAGDDWGHIDKRR